MKKMEFPKFNNLEDEAAFWDTHSFADYWDSLAPTSIGYASKPDKKEIMTIRIDPSLKRQIEKMARSYSLSPSSLIRMWLVDRVRETADPHYKI